MRHSPMLNWGFLNIADTWISVSDVVWPWAGPPFLPLLSLLLCSRLLWSLNPLRCTPLIHHLLLESLLQRARLLCNKGQTCWGYRRLNGWSVSESTVSTTFFVLFELESFRPKSHYHLLICAPLPGPRDNRSLINVAVIGPLANLSCSKLFMKR